MWPVFEFFWDRAAFAMFMCLLCGAGLVIGLRHRFRRDARWFAAGCGMMAVAHAQTVAFVALMVLLSTDVTNRFRSLFDMGSPAAVIYNGLYTIAGVAGLACLIIGFAKITRPHGPNSELPTPNSQRDASPMSASLLPAVWLTPTMMNLVPFQVMMIVKSIVCLALVICGFSIARRRKRAGAAYFVAGCGLLAALGLYETLANALYLFEIDDEALFTNTLALELWQALNSARDLCEAAGIGLLIWGTWRCLHDAETAGNHVRAASH